MTMTRRSVLLAGAAAGPLLTTSALLAQPGLIATSPLRHQSYGQILLANKLALSGTEQITISDLAARRAEHPDVRAFAVAEVEEQMGIAQNLQRLGFTPPQLSEQILQLAGPTLPRAATSRAVSQIPFTYNPPADGNVDALQLDQEMSRQCIVSRLAELERLEGVLFDKAYVAHQLLAHLGLWDASIVFRRHALTALRETIDLARPTIQNHIQVCRRLGLMLDGSSDVARR